MAFRAQPLSLDVSDVVGEQASLAATYYPPRASTAAGAVLVCLPGGTYSREYWDLNIPGHHRYSFADFATENGYAVAPTSPPSCWPAARTATTWRRLGIGCGGEYSPGQPRLSADNTAAQRYYRSTGDNGIL